MIPNTRGGLPAMACISAMQKCIRRGMEREAMEFAVELGASSKNFATMVCNRLEIISHEDVGDPGVIMFVATCVEQAKRLYDPTGKKPGKWRMPVGNAIRAMARSPKTREGDHFTIVCGLQSDIGKYVPEIPDWAFDSHTAKGRKLGRGLDYFIEESTKLVGPDGPITEVDRYTEEAHEWLKVKSGEKKLT